MRSIIRAVRDRHEGKARLRAWESETGLHYRQRRNQLTLEQAWGWTGRLAIVTPYHERARVRGGDKEVAAKTEAVVDGLWRGLRLGDERRRLTIRGIELSYDSSDPIMSEPELLAVTLGRHSIFGQVLSTAHPAPNEQLPYHSSIKKVPPVYLEQWTDRTKSRELSQGINLATIINVAGAYPPPNIHTDPFVAIASLEGASIEGLEDTHSLYDGGVIVMAGVDREAGRVRWYRAA